MDFKNLFLSANGRIGRGEFWIAFVILFVAQIIINMLAHAVHILGLLGLVLIYFNVCVYSKRLHDMGKSGWLQLVPIAVFLVAGVIAGVMGGTALLTAMANSGAANANPSAMMAALGSAGLAIGVAGLVALGFLLWVGLSPGEAGDNKYGSPPKKAQTAAA
jgi:uncharacterized membrane protein YhaH (DUF805 family)